MLLLWAGAHNPPGSSGVQLIAPGITYRLDGEARLLGTSPRAALYSSQFTSLKYIPWGPPDTLILSTFHYASSRPQGIPEHSKTVSSYVILRRNTRDRILNRPGI